MAAILTEIVGAVTQVGTAFLTSGSVLQYAVGLSIFGLAFRLVRKAVRR